MFNKNTTLSTLATRFFHYKPLLLSKEWGDEEFWQHAFENECIPSHKRYRLLTKLHTLIEDFWVVNYTLADPYYRKEALIYTYMDFQFHDWVKTEIQQLEQTLIQSDIHNTLYRQYRLKVEKMKVTHAWQFQQRGKIAHDILYPLIHALDDYYLIYRLELCSYLQYIQSMQQYDGQQHDTQFIEQTLGLIEQNAEVWKSIQVQVYYYLVKMSHYSIDYSNLIIEIVQKNESKFHSDELTNIYTLLRGFYTLKAQKGDENAISILYILYRTNIDKGWIYNRNGEILPSIFLNYLFTSIDCGQTLPEITEYIRTFSPKLPIHSRADTLLIAEALCAFVAKDYTQALQKIRIAKTPDLINNIKVRRLEIKTYYEMGEVETVINCLNTFRVFIQRCEGIQLNIVQANRNFASELKRLIDTNPPQPHDSLDAKSRIQKLDVLVEYWWLKDKWRFEHSSPA